jgi:hypothetical protein
VIPAGATLGQASTHLPQRVQASSMSSTRLSNAVSKEISLIGCDSGPWTRYHPQNAGYADNDRLRRSGDKCDVQASQPRRPPAGGQKSDSGSTLNLEKL